MALDFTGIDNVEFYSGHYLDAVLEGDLKDLFRRWKERAAEGGGRQPQERLAGLAARYHAARDAAEGETDAGSRLAAARDFHAHLLEALGYPREPVAEPLGDSGHALPVALALRKDGRPFLWVVEAPFPAADDEDALAQPPRPEQFPLDADTGSPDPSLLHPSEEGDGPASWRELLDEAVFRQENAPRFVLALAGRETFLAERGKWGQGRHLRFDWGELLGRRHAPALRAAAGLLHRDALAPADGACLHDTLDENSHAHAHAVSSDLKHGVRRAVELLANEAVRYRREVQKQGVFNEEELAAQLTDESLRWLYRLLFLFYVEARSAELSVVPMGSEAYRKGYSLETLRDLELVPLTTEHAREGFFLHDSLKVLFRILNSGFPEVTDADRATAPALRVVHGGLEIDALSSPLFDDERLPLLKGVRFRNVVLQEVLRLLSLSAEGRRTRSASGKRHASRGRISYAQLGINQLGAVYEGLLSYTGFFATEDLHEVAPPKEAAALAGKAAAARDDVRTWFVPGSRIGEYRDDEIVRDEHGKRVTHPKGSYLFRLAGRNREKSASYYTPEVLTRCLVKYALKELLWEDWFDVLDERRADPSTTRRPVRRRTADEILDLRVCEPAMGSGAFLAEAVDQLADCYLEAKQEELDREIRPDDYQRERRRVKARLATSCCHGVDLNPIAVELAKTSLWLATLHEGGKCPWFGLRLATGNSLIGARRQVFRTADVTRKGSKAKPNWLGLVPDAVPLHWRRRGEPAPPEDDAFLPKKLPPPEWPDPSRPTPPKPWEAGWALPPRPKGSVYHFLLPADGMAPFDKDAVVKV